MMHDKLLHLQADMTFAFRKRRITIAAMVVRPVTQIARTGDFMNSLQRPALLFAVGHARPDSVQCGDVGWVQIPWMIAVPVIVRHGGRHPRARWSAGCLRRVGFGGRR